ncbi:TetR/AcrR family transcriptional regulator [Mycolicibacterium pallens]|uniref:TetR/AcrR family transcriptional regulator n=1 Tax=Mycolicibacterium pallens TaxID=370524 RepID=A0ABX8VRG5_9MYCO|nr:TetR/AcrR family transcriptional regulator [Mycolicibacterium pallens]QYL18616.1 TetR/AcrR family transcriptional regulator [Mycolicibacterium pallens]
MAGAEVPAGNRLERRKMQTRAALVRAAQGFIAAGNLNAPVLEITQAADVGMGSFYNHFESKEELFEAAVNDTLDQLGALLDKLSVDGEDPALTFARSFRIVGRLFRHLPETSRVLLNTGLTLMHSDRGLGPRALRDITVAAEAGRFTVADPELALSVAAGALMGLGQLLRTQPERDGAESSDHATRGVLVMLGLSAEEADEICAQPLPDLDELIGTDAG